MADAKVASPDIAPGFVPITGGLEGTRLGRYEIIGQIASGGMGVVYLARTAGEAGFQRLFAIKVIHEHLAREPEFVAMLLDEARLTSHIHHPKIVPIVDLGREGDRYYLVMDYVEGCSLSQLCRRHPDARDPAKFVPLVVDALEGLHAAHTLTDDDDEPLRLVHRDVSGQNIMVGVDGVARVVDFGIAKAEARITSTQPGIVKGKVALLSPEQILSTSSIDARSDIFSAGAMLWWVLTATHPFGAETEGATLNNIIHRVFPPPSTVGLRPHPCFDAVCLKALERDRDKRYQTAAEMAHDLRMAALENGFLAERHEIADWVKSAFAKEFAARHQAIRLRALGVPALLHGDDVGTPSEITRSASDLRSVQRSDPSFTGSRRMRPSDTPIGSGTSGQHFALSASDPPRESLTSAATGAAALPPPAPSSRTPAILAALALAIALVLAGMQLARMDGRAAPVVVAAPAAPPVAPGPTATATATAAGTAAPSATASAATSAAAPAATSAPADAGATSRGPLRPRADATTTPAAPTPSPKPATTWDSDSNALPQ
jgi:serine/threonine-protein kinase